MTKIFAVYSATPIERWWEQWLPYCSQHAYELCHKEKDHQGVCSFFSEATKDQCKKVIIAVEYEHG